MKKEDIKCPTCGKAHTWINENPFRPFCSARCKLIDLGDWASEKHSIPGDSADLPSENDKENEK